MLDHEKVGGKETKTVLETEISKWLAPHLGKECGHDWDVFSGWNSKNNLAWDGESKWHMTLLEIKSLNLAKEEENKLLERYFSVRKIADATSKYAELKTFSEDLGQVKEAAEEE